MVRVEVAVAVVAERRLRMSVAVDQVLRRQRNNKELIVVGVRGGSFGGGVEGGRERVANVFNGRVKRFDRIFKILCNYYYY